MRITVINYVIYMDLKQVQVEDLSQDGQWWADLSVLFY